MEGGRGLFTEGLGHLLIVELQVAVAADGAGPPLRLVVPHGHVVVQAERQVVLDQVLA